MKKVLMNREEEILNHFLQFSKFSEKEMLLKGKYLMDVFAEYDVKDTKMDLYGNIVARIKGNSNEAVIVNCNFEQIKDFENIKIKMKEICNIGPAGNTLELCALLLLGDLIKNHYLHHNIYLLASVGGKTDYKGLRYFLENVDEKINGIINLKTMELGNISKSNFAVSRVNIDFIGNGGDMWQDYSESNPIEVAALFIRKLKEEEFDDSLVFNISKLTSGVFYDIIPDRAHLELELRSFKDSEIGKATQAIKEITEGLSKEENINIRFKQVLRKKAMTVEFSQLEEVFKETQEELNIKTYSITSNSEVSLGREFGIDTLTVGLANGENRYRRDEQVEIVSFYKGIENVYKALMKLDKKYRGDLDDE